MTCSANQNPRSHRSHTLEDYLVCLEHTLSGQGSPIRADSGITVFDDRERSAIGIVDQPPP